MFPYIYIYTHLFDVSLVNVVTKRMNRMNE